MVIRLHPGEHLSHGVTLQYRLFSDGLELQEQGLLPQRYQKYRQSVDGYSDVLLNEEGVVVIEGEEGLRKVCA